MAAASFVQRLGYGQPAVFLVWIALFAITIGVEALAAPTLVCLGAISALHTGGSALLVVRSWHLAAMRSRFPLQHRTLLAALGWNIVRCVSVVVAVVAAASPAAGNVATTSESGLFIALAVSNVAQYAAFAMATVYAICAFHIPLIPPLVSGNVSSLGRPFVFSFCSACPVLLGGSLARIF